MPYCSRCGVEVDAGVDRCPLCDLPIQRFDETAGQAGRRYPERYRYAPVSGGMKRLVLWLVLTALFLTAFLVVLTVNLVLDGGITWGRYALAGIGAGWIYAGILILFINIVPLIIAANFAATAGFLALLDVFDGSLDWFLWLGLPISGMVTAASLLVVLFVWVFKKWPALLASSVLFTIGAFCIGLDLLVSGYRGETGMTWSFVVIFSLYPLALLLFLFHFVFRNRLDLGRFFHV